MSLLLQQHLQSFLVFVLVLTRISGMFLLAPALSSISIPMQVRGFLAFAMALVLMPFLSTMVVDLPVNLLELAVVLAQELLLGLSLAVAAMIFVTGIQLAGQIMSHMGSLSLGESFDPSSGTNMPVIAQFLGQLAVVSFLLTGGHRWMIRSLLDMYQQMPPGRIELPPDLIEALVWVTALSFETAVSAAAPVIVALLLSMLVMGIISRTLPQLNILAVGFSANVMLMLATLMMTLGMVVWLFQDRMEVLLQVTWPDVLIGSP